MVAPSVLKDLLRLQFESSPANMISCSSGQASLSHDRHSAVCHSFFTRTSPQTLIWASVRFPVPLYSPQDFLLPYKVHGFFSFLINLRGFPLPDVIYQFFHDYQVCCLSFCYALRKTRIHWYVSRLERCHITFCFILK